MLKVCTVDEIVNSNNFKELIQEYAEYGVKELKVAGIKLEFTEERYLIYKQLEKLNVLRIVGAFEAEKLIGLLVIIINNSMHYGIKINITETLFVLEEYRKTGTGLKLIREAEKYAMETTKALIINSQTGSTLEELLIMDGYTEIYKSFVKIINEPII